MFGCVSAQTAGQGFERFFGVRWVLASGRKGRGETAQRRFGGGGY